MRLLDEQALRDIATGSAVLGTGGGGDPYLGTLVSLQALGHIARDLASLTDDSPETDAPDLPVATGP